MTAVHVRRLRADEWPALRAVRLAALADAPGAFGSTMARELAFGEAEWRERVANAPNFIAWCDDKPVGLVTVICRQNDDGTGSPPEWELVSMWVSPDARGSGAADLLVSAIADVVRAESGRQVTLWVADGNDRARAFYLKAGFRPTGLRQTYRRGDGSAFDEEKLAMPLPPIG